MSKQTNIDFNADAGQGFGIYGDDYENEVVKRVSSVNIACGFHAGDPITIKNAMLFTKGKSLELGALIGYPDLQGFGRRAMELDADEIEALVLYQLGAVSSFAKAFSLSIEHVRLHGAMYDKAADNYEFMLNVANAVKKFDKWMVLYAPFGEIADKVEADAQMIIAREIEIDKGYDSEGKPFIPSQPLSEDIMLNRIRTILHSGKIKLPGGEFLPVKCDTLHFDVRNPGSAGLLDKAREIILPTPVNYNKAALSGWLSEGEPA